MWEIEAYMSMVCHIRDMRVDATKSIVGRKNGRFGYGIRFDAQFVRISGTIFSDKKGVIRPRAPCPTLIKMTLTVRLESSTNLGEYTEAMKVN
jgi:hypothetical protein